MTAAPWLVLLGALVLRLVGLTRQPLWYDEAFLLSLAQLDLVDWAYQVTAPSAVPAWVTFFKAPALVPVLHAWVALAGTSEATLRLPFVALGLASLALTHRLALRWLGPRRALAALVLLAAHPMHVYYSRQISEYGLLLVVCLGSLYLFVERTSSTRGHAPALALVLAAAGVMVHPSALLVLGVELALLLADRRYRHRRWLWAVSSLVGAAAFVAGTMLVRGGAYQTLLSWTGNVSLRAGLTLARELAHGVMARGTLDRQMLLARGGGLVGSLGVLVALAALAGAVVLARRRGGLSGPMATTQVRRTLLAWIALPPLAVVLYSLALGNLLVGRYLIVVLPALMVLVVLGVETAARGSRPQVFCLLAIVVELMLNAAYLQHTAPVTSTRDAARRIQAGWRPGDRLVITPEHLMLTAAYYLDGDVGAWTTRHRGSYTSFDATSPWQATHAYHPTRHLPREGAFRRWVEGKTVWLLADPGYPGDTQTRVVLRALHRTHLKRRSWTYPWSGEMLVVFDPRP